MRARLLEARPCPCPSSFRSSARACVVLTRLRKGRVEATLDQYEEAHFARDDYFILRDHLRVEGEEIIGEEDGYHIVRKALVSPL